ncbi:MAG: bifunctional folylpolyglutamate synthase/dihydrofolate synthase, dihydrofolate synthase / folylpolyglutamate synthase [Candidatus Peregrinibacteria bacterium GW2011_GWE2_39_6]|nr:MAG: bifunctional folylpolyglutamate synthase/dihydrofolate synthase, dihydrofolate synthase / folylpolyglutamate synthase [Candidatus Peregrinibacteria bacterium GW2011_GWF2_39_17]KKR25715.1 MAG: bifunctional folylpolyglutamate synthase/dihydrofolate synthase, dihydrofolate synthase / folylpolyglutamate synthase [Candidatus Peregrinibacteria bacterium GW2011_GWE2_39_6]HCW32894.1 hypothetical protein [Candidatus Peregrinibacteria bacterium]
MDETITKIFSRLPAYDRFPPQILNEETFDLSRFQRFLTQVNNPHKGLPIIHIAGSKGKGSTAALLGSALQALGKQVGVYFSPYLGSPTEAIFVNGKPISKEKFNFFLTNNDQILQKLTPQEQITAFELLTTIALQYFHEADVDFAILETGLGGRLDATNVIESPILSLITPIEKEHTDLLGNSITSIAYEKLGIVRENIPVIFAPQTDPFIQEFARNICLQKKAPFIPITSHYNATIKIRTIDHYSFRLQSPYREIPQINLALLGDHQVQNALSAWAALDHLLPKFNPELVLDVWQHLTLPGRFEQREIEEHQFILDGAHTLNSAKTLRKTLTQIYGIRPFTFILAFLNDKNIEGFCYELLRQNDTVILTQINHPRALPARIAEEKIRTLIKNQNLTSIITNDLKIAKQKAYKLSKKDPICATGSFKLIEEI